MKTIFKISIALIYLGWFGFMWFALGYPHIESETVKMVVFFLSFMICIFAGLGFAELLQNNDLFKSIKELRDERDWYKQVRRELNYQVDKLISEGGNIKFKVYDHVIWDMDYNPSVCILVEGDDDGFMSHDGEHITFEQLDGARLASTKEIYEFYTDEENQRYLS